MALPVWGWQWVQGAKPAPVANGDIHWDSLMGNFYWGDTCEWDLVYLNPNRYPLKGCWGCLLLPSGCWG